MCAPAAAQYSRQRTAALVTRCPSRPAMALQPSSRTPPATPATPSALLATAPTVPAQCVPWPSASCARARRARSGPGLAPGVHRRRNAHQGRPGSCPQQSRPAGRARAQAVVNSSAFIPEK
jgi:hypothetical protein